MEGIKLITSPEVYEPSDDSYMFVEVLKDYNDLEGYDVLDIGTGTGILAIIAAQKGASVIATDINENAIEIAKKNAMLNDVHERSEGKIEFIKSDLFENITKKFDVIFFNPPYLPINDNADDKINYRSYKSGSLIEKAWNDNGAIVKFFGEVDAHLKSCGNFLILLSSLTKISLDKYKEKFRLRKIASKKLFFEEIFVLEGSTKK